MFSNNTNEYNILDAIKLLDYYLLKTSADKSLVISKKDDLIIVFNNNLKITMSKNDFKLKFSDYKFYILKALNEEVEINTEYKKLRQ